MEAIKKADEIRAEYAGMDETDYSQLVEYLEARMPLPSERVEIILSASVIDLVQMAWDEDTVQAFRRFSVPLVAVGLFLMLGGIMYEVYDYVAPILAHGLGDFFTSLFDGAKEAGQVVGWFFVCALSLAAAALFLTRKKPEAEPELFQSPTRPGNVTAGDVAEAGRIIHNHFYNQPGEKLPGQ